MNKYVKLILKNPFRNRARSLLGIIGISVGIAAIISLGLITGGLHESTQNTLNEGAGEISVSKYGSSGLINMDLVNDIRNITGVKDATGVLTLNLGPGGTTSSGAVGQAIGHGADSLVVKGIAKDHLNLVGIENINGTVFNEDKNEVIIGINVAKNQNKTIGDSIEILGEEFIITGIYETGNILQDNLVFTSLHNLQNLSDSKNQISEIVVKADKNVNVTKLSDNIKNSYVNKLDTTTSEEQAERANHVIETIDMASIAISLLAIIIGSLGVINTMIMSVYERTREIGVLKAVGWTNIRILIMILGETIVLMLISGVVGTIFGVLAVELGLLFLNTDVLTPAYSIDIFIRAFIIALSVGLIGGLYPAYRASKLSPTEALKYE